MRSTRYNTTALSITLWLVLVGAIASDETPRALAQEPITPTAAPTAAQDMVVESSTLPAPDTQAPLPAVSNPNETAQAIGQLPLAPEAVPAATPPLILVAPSLPATKPLATPRPATRPVATPPEPLRSIIRRLKLPLPLPNANIIVNKSQRRLDLMSGNTVVKSYGVALGANPVGHKQSQGDSRTPEGRFYICTRNAQTSAFHIFLGLSYPALPDATRGVNSKQISWREYQVIRQQLSSRGAPLWRTRLGGWVGIHGGTGTAFANKQMQKRGRNDWTAGCIALTNKEIEEIYAATRLGTPVVVRP